MAEADLSRRIAEYLLLNGFANLKEAAAKGWGDTRPLMIRPDHRSERHSSVQSEPWDQEEKSPPRFEPAEKAGQPAAATRQPQQERARRALRALFGSKVPDAATLPNKHLAEKVNKWLKDHQQPPVGQRTVQRAASRK
jgi:hypothetical protein